jgi:hypothetical protein
MTPTDQAILDLVLSTLDKHPNVAPLVHEAVSKKFAGHLQRTRPQEFHCYMPIHAPASRGDAEVLSRLTLQCANELVPALRGLFASVGRSALAPVEVADFVASRGHASSTADLLKDVFTRHGSDKATQHRYYILYDYILRNRPSIDRVFEIGLGTNNTDVVSNMEAHGRPGASLRAFREWLPAASIYGADIDRRILFAEDRIKTFWVDQTDPTSFAAIGEALPGDGFDLMIDDGLHAPYANVLSLQFFLPRLKIGGWAVVEDIRREAVPVWQIVQAMLPSTYESFVVSESSSWMSLFAVRRTA